ncbi:MAG: hypothetical protein V1838_04205 [Patescibacteria group bacterium]
MNEFKQHIPNFIDIEDPPAVKFETTDDLLNLEIVQRYGKGKDFSHFAISGNCLMEISDEGEGLHWWVVGYIKEPDKVDIPKFEGGKYRAKLPNGEIVTLTSEEVCSSFGNKLTLKNGTKVIRIG